MTEPAARRPWWKKKRWRTFVAAWLALPPVLYLAAEGPVLYCIGRGWLPTSAYNRVYFPVWSAVEPALPVKVQAARFHYLHWWMDRANSDR